MAAGVVSRQKSGGFSSPEIVRVGMVVCVGFLMAAVGFLSSEVISSGKEIAVLKRSSITLEDALKLIREHESRPHAGSVTRSELQDTVRVLEKRIEAELRPIQAELKRISDRIDQRLERLERLERGSGK